MPKIFLSYRRNDSPAHAGRLYDRLEAEFGRDQVFMDIDAIDLGTDFVERINASVGSCDVLLALIGPEWSGELDENGRPRIFDTHDFVRLEIASALKRDVRVVPLLVAGAQMPSAADLPRDLRGLARRHALELSDTRWAHDASTLIESLNRFEAESQPPTQPVVDPGPPATTPQRAQTRRLRPAWVLAGGAVVAAAVGALVLAGGNEDPSSPATATERSSAADGETAGADAPDADDAGSPPTEPVRIAEAGYSTLKPPTFSATTKEFASGSFQTVFAAEDRSVAITKLAGQVPRKPNGSVISARDADFNRTFAEGSGLRYVYRGGTCRGTGECVAFAAVATDGDGYRVSGSADDPYVEIAAAAIRDD